MIGVIYIIVRDRSKVIIPHLHSTHPYPLADLFIFAPLPISSVRQRISGIIFIISWAVSLFAVSQ